MVPPQVPLTGSPMRRTGRDPPGRATARATTTPAGGVADAFTGNRVTKAFTLEGDFTAAPPPAGYVVFSRDLGKPVDAYDGPGAGEGIPEAGLSLAAALRYVRSSGLSDADQTAVLSGNAQRLWQGGGE